MNLNYVENILFQNENYPSIVESYSMDYEVLLDENSEISDIEKEYIYIWIHGNKTITESLEELFSFHIPQSRLCQNSCILEYSIQDEIDEINGIMRVKTTHSFPCVIYNYYISKDINEDILRKSYTIFIYGDNQPEIYDMQKIKHCVTIDDVSDIVFSNIEDLKEKLMNNRVYHTISLEKKEIEEKPLIKEIHKESVILMIAHGIYNNFDRDIGDLEKDCVELLMQYFHSRCKEILRNVLHNDFIENYIIIEMYLNYVNEVYEAFYKDIRDNVMSTVKKMKGQILKNSKLQNMLLAEKSINNLDELVKNKVEGLYDRLEEVF